MPKSKEKIAAAAAKRTAKAAIKAAKRDAALAETESSRKRKAKEYNTLCVCCNPFCDEAMENLKELNPKRYSYFEVPSKPKDTTLLKGGLRKNMVVKRQRKIHRRERFLAALGDAATARANDERYSRKTSMRIASLHFRDEIYNQCQLSARNCRLIIESITPELARQLTEDGCPFTEDDKYADDGSYVPLPNNPIEAARAYVDSLEGKTPDQLEIERLNMKIQGLTIRNEIQSRRIKELEQTVKEQTKELARRPLSYEQKRILWQMESEQQKRQMELEKKMELEKESEDTELEYKDNEINKKQQGH